MIAALIVVIPFGIAIQNVVTSLCFFILLFHFYKNPTGLLKNLKKTPLILAGVFLFCHALGTYLAQREGAAELVKFLFGYAGFLLIPSVFYAYCQNSNISFSRVFKTLNLVLVIWGCIVFSQYLFSWALKGNQIIDYAGRPKGFFSHPLTLAYSAALFWPFTLNQLILDRKKILNWLAALSIFIIIVTTLSRTIQALALLVVVWSFMTLLPKKQKVLALLVAGIFAGIIAATDNPISNKFKITFDPNDEGKPKSAEYLDERFAFWHAHWEMIKERPLFGHGINTDTAFRTPYYDKIGLSDYSRKYEAHNQYIQVATNAGFVSLFFFLAWLLWFFKQSLAIGDSRRLIIQQTLTLFALGGLTQNALQDSEVRFIFCLFTILLLSNAPLLRRGDDDNLSLYSPVAR